MSDERTRSLALARQRLLALGPSERLDALLEDPRRRDLVRALPAQELYLTLVVGGLDRAFPLLSHASRHQLDFILDIDGWTGDELDAERTGRWLSAFAQADPEVVRRWLAEGDEATVVLAVSRMIHVYKLDESTSEDRWPPDRPLPTLEGLYYVDGRDGVPDEALEALWAGLRLLCAERTAAYAAILEQVLWLIPAEQEEEAWSRRWSRLADRGFPEGDEAFEVRAPGEDANPDRRAANAARILARALAEADAEPASPEAPPTINPRPSLPVESVEGSRLARAANGLDKDPFDAFSHGLVRLANRFSVADRGDLGEPATHARALETAVRMAALGLDIVLSSPDAGHGHDAEEDARVGASVLLTENVARIARLGVGAIEERAARAYRIARSGWLGRVHLGRERLDAELDEVLTGLLLHRPRLHAGGVEREFESAADLASADADLRAIEALGAYLEGDLAAGANELPELAALIEAGRPAAEITWTSVVLTSLARRALEGDGRPRPLGQAQAVDAVGALLATGGDDVSLLRRLAGAAGLEAAAWLLERRLNEDAPAFTRGAAIDARFVRSLLLA